MFNINKKRRERAIAQQDVARRNLFDTLDDNFELHFAGQHCWRELQQIDAEISPGSIFLEANYAPADGHQYLRETPDGDAPFDKGDTTIVLQLHTREMAMRGSALLNKIFKGTGTLFMPEVVQRDGKETFQIRTNLDKQHWDKLSVFCHYRYAREIEGTPQCGAINAQCEQVIDAYTKGTSDEGWHNLEGVPAFITLMGVHGVLRPQGHQGVNIKRKQAEFSQPHPRGTPRVFDGVTVHVELKARNQKGVVLTPYNYGFQLDRAARESAMDGKKPFGLLREALGGDPLQPNIGWTSRALYASGLFFGLTSGGTLALQHAGYHVSDILAQIAPAVSVGTTATVAVTLYVHNRMALKKRLDAYREKWKERQAGKGVDSVEVELNPQEMQDLNKAIEEVPYENMPAEKQQSEPLEPVTVNIEMQKTDNGISTIIRDIIAAKQAEKSEGLAPGIGGGGEYYRR